MKRVIQDDTHVLALEIGEELVESILRYSEQSEFMLPVFKRLEQFVISNWVITCWIKSNT
jgi:hypothetical protein